MWRLLIGLALALIALPPQHAWAQDRGPCWYSNASPDLVIAGCTDLIKSGRSPSGPENTFEISSDYAQRGDAYEKKHLYDRAIADYTQAIALEPNFDNYYNSRAWAYHLKGEDTKGLPDAQKAVVLSPIADNIETRAEIYEKLGQRDKAIADYRAALKQKS